MRKKKSKSPRTARSRLHHRTERLRTPNQRAAYLDARLAQTPNNAGTVARALGELARAKGMSSVARDAGLCRESLYKALSEHGNPSFSTVLRVAKAIGLRLHAQAM